MAEPFDLLARAVEARALQNAALRTVAEATGEGGPDDGPPPYPQHAARPGFRVVGVHRDSRLAGFAYGADALPGSWWDTWVRGAMTEAGCVDLLDGAFEVVSVHVDPRHHGQGLGRELVRDLLADRPHPRAVLTTQTGANPARGFYRRLGFGELPVQVPYDGVDFVVLAADLPLGRPA
ncbi:hypothetical protein GCM10027446_26320 [Angustibacter peucedani]